MYCSNCSSEHFLPSDFIIYKKQQYCVSCFDIEEIESKEKIKDKENFFKMNIKAFDMLVDLQCTVMHLLSVNKISNHVFNDLNTEIQKIIDQMDIDGEIF